MDQNNASTRSSNVVPLKRGKPNVAEPAPRQVAEREAQAPRPTTDANGYWLACQRDGCGLHHDPEIECIGSRWTGGSLRAELAPEMRRTEAMIQRLVYADRDALATALATKLTATSAPAVAPASSQDVPLTPDLFDGWLASIDGSTEGGTRKEYRRIALVQWVPFFETLGAIGGRVKAYTNDRLKRVSKTMHKKELSALRGFLAWAEEQGHIADAPHVQAPPRKATGKHSATSKTVAVSVSEEEIERIIGLLPEWTRARRGDERHRVRDVFVLAWETGLRPITIGRLSVPEHWRPGMRSLNITAASDKSRFARELPITPRAVEVLERCAPASGLVFGRHDYRALIKNAARDAGLDLERAKHFSKYDFRHNRADFLLDQGADLRAVAYNHGHKLLTTTDKYLRPSKKGAEAMLAKVAERSVARSDASAEAGASSGASSASGACSCTAECVLDEVQAGEYTSLPTRTWRNWQTHQIQVLAG